ncbi:MAG: transcription antitermination factor NusB [Planctomycetaceae bacterium]|nr:MAG: transcription antitermination factor NusB [Planctomycetaceae bacterium]
MILTRTDVHTRMGTDKRTRARELAMQALYQLDVQGSELLSRLRGDFFYEEEGDERTRKLAWEWTTGTWEKVAECDEMITGSTIRWQFSRLSPVDRSILRLAVYQLKFCPDIPPKVVINEAIELAKRYSTDKSGPFVNGVLDAVLKKMQVDHRPVDEQKG